MAQKVILYRCEICGREYSYEEKATECEASHLVPVSVDSPMYNLKDNKIAYPESVMIHFKQGDKKIKARYYRKP